MIRAKMRCIDVTEFVNGDTPEELKTGESVVMSDGEDVNKEWAAATPSANLMMHISNPSAWGQFKTGECYFVDFSPCGK